MFRFAAMRWNPADPKASSYARAAIYQLKASSSEWQVTANAPGLVLFHAGMRPGSSEAHVLPNGRGVVFGKLFKQAVNPADVGQPVVLDAKEAAKIVKTGGRHLIDAYWGRYVAFVQDPDSYTLWVLRGPASALPCFHAHVEGVHLFCSFTDDLTKLGLFKISHNWKYITAYAFYSISLSSSDTALNEFKKLQFGECYELPLQGDIKKSRYWNLVEIARADPIEHFDDAVKETLRATQLSVWGWASCYPQGIMQLLSGGFDSSTMLRLLHTAPHRPRVACLHYYNPHSPAGDERDKAELANKDTGYPLTIHVDLPGDADLRAVMDIPSSAEPWFMQYFATHSHAEDRIAREHGVSAIFQGVGGDQISYQGPLSAAPVDHMYRYGFGRGAFRLIADVAQSERLSRWMLLRRAIGEGWRERPWDPEQIPITSKLMTSAAKEAARSTRYMSEPWGGNVDVLSVAKCEHLRMLLVPESFYDPLAPADACERVWPYVSQLLLENAARTPLSFLARGGVDRAVARYAFRHILPPQIVRRRAKGIIDQYFQRLVHTHASFIEELMLDGILVKEGIYDKAVVERAIRHPLDIHAEVAAHLMAYGVGLEASLRKMINSQQRIAA